jgi:hypothetical protein
VQDARLASHPAPPRAGRRPGSIPILGVTRRACGRGRSACGRGGRFPRRSRG